MKANLHVNIDYNESCMEINKLNKTFQSIFSAISLANNEMESGNNNRAILNYASIISFYKEKENWESYGICCSNFAYLHQKQDNNDDEKFDLERQFLNEAIDKQKYVCLISAKS